ncbi:hypothetical protein D3C81_1725660 [compost metagenome]
MMYCPLQVTVFLVYGWHPGNGWITVWRSSYHTAHCAVGQLALVPRTTTSPVRADVSIKFSSELNPVIPRMRSPMVMYAVVMS